jgi:SAM-dependent methyltransferase
MIGSESSMASNPARTSNQAMTCEACGSPLALRFADASDPLSGHKFDVFACTSCDLGQTVPAPDDLGAYYGQTYYGERHSLTADYCAWRRVRIVERATGKVTSSILDIGCGDGTFLLAAAKRGHRTLGTEMGDAARRARTAGVDVRDSLEAVRDAAPVDVVTMWHTLEHFRSPREVVTAVASLLRPGGTFIVAVPDARGLQARVFKRNWFHLDVPRHLYHFGAQSLQTLLERAGFRIEKWHHQELEYDVFGWLQSGLNALTGTPNVLFQSMTGKPSQTSELGRLAHYAMGTLLAPAAVLATAAGSAMRRGGTLIAVARAPSR